ncbi:MAG: secretin and TonB N-terminal domain-containing protein [Deltaproteobacteria bacterium]|nr:secretin and TonB N-terminal domain-containing protein [Deltaproteobacteria bacterium]
MKRNMQWTWIALLAGFVMFFGNVPYAGSAPPGTADSGGTAATGVKEVSVGYLEKITVEKLKGKERVTLIVSKQSGVNIDSMAGNGVVVKMENMFVPEELRRPQAEGKLSNVIRVVPAQKSTNGAQWAMIAIDLKERVPYSVSQQGQNVLIDFNVTTLESKAVAVTQIPSVPVLEAPGKGSGKPAGTVGRDGDSTQRYLGRKISLDFQDANIKAVLRLMAEEGGITIVSGDDVKGNVTVHMKKVPWDQALETILDINGLAKKQMGDIISVMSLEKMKKDESDRQTAEGDRVKAELTAKKAEQERLEERGKLAQISIEAKIVEATDDFVRNLGVQWGGVGYGSINSTGWTLMGGSNPTQGRGISWGYPNEVGMRSVDGKTIQSMTVNYPTSLASPAIGLVVGGASAVLEAQIAALETTSQGKIISSPKITTMDNVKATIKQGQEIPFITIDKDGNRSITFKEAVLKLEVKPKITPDGKISMEIKATNDQADYARAPQLGGNPPINKSEVESKIVVQDGDTIVIGGILKTEDTSGESGIPWLSKIPILGWLFKAQTNTKNRRQMMVFVTPRIIKVDAVGEKPPKPTKG